MAWRVWSVDTRSGQKQSVIPVTGFTWMNALNQGSGGSATVLLNDQRMAGLNFRDLFDLVRRTLVIEWDGHPVYAGVIWDWTYDYDSKRLSINHSDIWSILSRRFLFTANFSTYAENKLTLASQSLWDLARGVVEQGLSGTGNSLPIFMQGTTGGSHTRTWYGYEIPVVLEELEAIMETEGGPDVAFVPRWSDDGSKLEWLMYDGIEVGGMIPVNLSANQKMLHGVKVKLDGNELSNLVIGTGEGAERRLMTAYKLMSGAAYPRLFSDASFPKEKVQATLQARTNAESDLRGVPTEQWSANMNASDAFRVTMVKLGRPFEIYTHGDPLLPNGQRRFRVIQYSGDLSETVKLELQEV
ncbi:hypothetical protein ACNPON_18510 [Glutamicibacter sp. AGC13]